MDGYKDRQIDIDRQTDRQRQRDRQAETDRVSEYIFLYLIPYLAYHQEQTFLYYRIMAVISVNFDKDTRQKKE